MAFHLHQVILTAAALTLTGCSAPEILAEANESAASPELNSAADKATANQSAAYSIELPAFPDLPAPKELLEAGDDGRIYYTTRSPYDFSVLLNDFENAPQNTGFGDLYLPRNASAATPVPAIVLMHGSGGISEGREHEHAQRLADQGIAAFVVDYYTPRGVTRETPYLLKTMAATETDLIVDAYAALDRLQHHPAIDGSRIGVMGFSYGGMASRYTMDERLKAILSPDGPGFALHVAFYGPCHQTTGHRTTTGAPYLAVYGDQDKSVDPAACAIVNRELTEGGSLVEAHILKDAGHAWENTAPREMGAHAYVRGCTFTFDPVTGRLLIDAKPATRAPANATRNQRASARMGLGADAGHCIGQGYLVGNDPVADAQAKSILDAFLSRHFNLANPE